MTTTPSILHSIILDALDARGWTCADLHRALVDRGVTLSFSAVYLWTTGGGVHDRHRMILAELLDVPFERLARAAAGVGPAPSDPSQAGA